jgi:hypothetical protein
MLTEEKLFPMHIFSSRASRGILALSGQTDPTAQLNTWCPHVFSKDQYRAKDPGAVQFGRGQAAGFFQKVAVFLVSFHINCTRKPWESG